MFPEEFKKKLRHCERGLLSRILIGFFFHDQILEYVVNGCSQGKRTLIIIHFASQGKQYSKKTEI